MKTLYISLLLSFTFMFGFASQNRKVLIIGIDGVRSDALVQANTPYMDAMIGNSLYSLSSWHTGITISGPSWSTILTGVQWNKHLVTGNSFPNADYISYPPFPTLAKQIKLSLNCSIVAEWSPLIDSITNASWDHAVKVPDGSNWPTADSAVAELQNPDLDLLFAYFDKVDLTGHFSTFSASNPLYISAIEDVDSAIGRVLNALYARPTYASEDWLILFITDHGGTSFSHGGNSLGEREIWWIAVGNAIAPQQITKADPGTYNCNADNVYDSTCVNLSLLKQSPTHPDIAVTALHHLIYDSGINPGTKPEWNLDGKSWLIDPNDVNDMGKEEDFTIFPNPASDHFIISGLNRAGERNSLIEVFSLDGRKLYSEVSEASELIIKADMLSSGMYLLKIGNAVKHFVIEK